MIRFDRDTSIEQLRRRLRDAYSLRSTIASGRSTPDRHMSPVDFGPCTTVREVEMVARRRFGVEFVLLDANGIRCHPDAHIGECAVPRDPIDANDVEQICRLLRQLGQSRDYADADRLDGVLNSWCPQAGSVDAFVRVVHCLADLITPDTRWGSTDLFRFLDRHATSAERRNGLASSTGGRAQLKQWLAANGLGEHPRSA